MIDVLKNFILTVNFLKGKFTSNEEIILIEKDNKSVKFIFEFEEELNEKNVLLKIKHYTGITKEQVLTISENKAELILTNDILIAGIFKMSISLIGTDNEILTSTEYLENITVKESLGEGETLNEEEVNTLKSLISQVSKLKNDLDNEVLGYELKHNNYRIVVTEEISKMTEYTLPFYYKVGNDSLVIFYNSERLLCEKSEDELAHYKEVGEVGTISNKVIFGWDIPIGRIFDFIVKGEHADG